MIEVDVASAVQDHFARIRRAALVLTGNPWDADDLAQETFLILARQGNSFQGRSGLYTWLYGILLNLERRERRRHGMRRRKLQVVWDNQRAGVGAAPAAAATVEVDEWRRGLWSQVARLPDGQREALVLRFSEHLAYDEIASVLGCPLGTVKSRIFNGLQALRGRMDADLEGLTSIPASPIAASATSANVISASGGKAQHGV
jgi:RNA polymerase sigma-70 factor (ECF subfamily)